MSERVRRIASATIMLLVVGAVCNGMVAPSVAGESLKKALTGGEVDFNFRYRYEHVDQDGFSENAGASTARLRMGYLTDDYFGISARIEFEALRSIGGQTYNSTQNGRTQYPTVADPEDEEINEAWFAYAAPAKTVLKLGRQRINLGNQRFVGAVDWRQLQQTFDAFSLSSKPGKNVSLFFAHLNKANRIFGEDNPVRTLADLDLDTNLAHVEVQTEVGKVTAYLHYLENQDSPAASHRNVGVRFAGKRAVSDRTDLLYVAEYTDQSDHEQAPSTVDADYRLLELGADFDPWVVKLGYEVLGGDGVYGFQTPLATGHKFNGWADRFLSTPASGLEDVYLSLARKLGRYRLLGVYHDFSADEGGSDYGSELDFLIVRSFEHMKCLLKYASYDADAPTTGPTMPSFALDNDVFWLMFEFKNDG